MLDFDITNNFGKENAEILETQLNDVFKNIVDTTNAMLSDINNVIVREYAKIYVNGKVYPEQHSEFTKSLYDIYHSHFDQLTEMRDQLINITKNLIPQQIPEMEEREAGIPQPESKYFHKELI